MGLEGSFWVVFGVKTAYFETEGGGEADPGASSKPLDIYGLKAFRHAPGKGIVAKCLKPLDLRFFFVCQLRFPAPRSAQLGQGAPELLGRPEQGMPHVDLGGVEHLGHGTQS